MASLTNVTISLSQHKLGIHNLSELDSQVQADQTGSCLKIALKRARDDLRYHPYPAAGACPRNGVLLVAGERWRLGENTYTSLALSDSIITSFSTAHFQSISQNPATWVQQIQSSLVANKVMWNGASLESTINMCICLTGHEVGVSFMLMLSRIHLFVILHSLVSPAGSFGNIKSIYRTRVQPIPRCPQWANILPVGRGWLEVPATSCRILTDSLTVSISTIFNKTLVIAMEGGTQTMPRRSPQSPIVVTVL
ncbi:hypothetical protein SERLA73DRAFT_150247 [Serpula lacrymans var. lacrymans S7.3]|uniref:Uncharacterized protein n=1 Tax=Serpula lacrymans var. lacrymans (strain S7.3) TaxID=936435 RepID=F8PLR1_SERL3|nr:hypothetical protein SERLA73DRAFT_150247 [Serpula lacrymans var. lacrymans S7.3]